FLFKFIERNKRMITLKNVDKIFSTKEKKIKAVDNVSLSIEAGEIYGIIGYSGAGKSTLIRMMNGLELRSSGEVNIDNQNFTELTHREFRTTGQDLGMIFKHFNVFWSPTVNENILIPLEIADVPKA